MKQSIVLIIVKLFCLYRSSEGQGGVFQFTESEIRVSENTLAPFGVGVENIGDPVATILIVVPSDVTATSGVDYNIANQEIVFAIFDPIQGTMIVLIDDDIVEGEESFVLNLQLLDPSQPDASLGARTSVTVIIEDDDVDYVDYSGDSQEAVVESITCGADGQGIEFVINIPDIAEWGVGSEAAWALVGTSDASCQPSFTANANKVTYGPFDGNTCKKTITETATHLEFMFEVDVQPSGGVTFSYDHHYQVTCQYNKEEQNVQASFLPLHSVSNSRQDDLGTLTFDFEIRFTADDSLVPPDITIDLTTGIFGRLTVNGAGFPALDVHYASVTATSDNGDGPIALITNGCSDDTAKVNNPGCGVSNVEDFVLTRGAFRFTGQTGDSSVTFFVTAVVCLNDGSTSQCETQCASCAGGAARKRRETVEESLATKYYLNAGPYKFANVKQVQKDSDADGRDGGYGSAFPTNLVAILVVSGVVAIAIATVAVVIVLRKRRRNATLAGSRVTYETGTGPV